MTDLTFDDGSDVVVVIATDDQPRSGFWVDHEELLHHLTGDEYAAGEFLGAAIDIDDDTDDGSQWGTVDEPAFGPGEL